MREHEREDVPAGADTGGFDASFAVFSLIHAGCGDDLVEWRIDEGLLLVWCPPCSVLGLFGPSLR
jgi:hypothetical protein